MAVDTDIRWKQRFENLLKASKDLEDALHITAPDKFQRAGIIKYFEMCFELAWNTMKDYLENEGFDAIRSPRAAIKKAFETELISDGRTWLECLESRNLLAHTYNEQKAILAEQYIRTIFFPLIQKFITVISGR